MPDDTILCWTWPEELRALLASPDEKRHVTKKDCEDWLVEGEPSRHKLAAFIRQRFRERYINPVQCLEPGEKNGFAIMAVSCLLIESYETFCQGWPSSDRKSALAFCYFFDREDRFRDFRGYAKQFYEHVRCGILHQGETTGGWTITRKETHPLFNPSGPTIHASQFHSFLADVIDDYAGILRNEPTTSDTWNKFKRKLQATLKSCEK